MDNSMIQQLQQINAQHDALQEQLNIVEQQMVELNQFRDELEVLTGTESMPVMVPLGKGVFAETAINPHQKLLVEIGAGFYIRKTIPKTLIVVEDQTKRLHEVKLHFTNEIATLTKQLEMYIKETTNP